MPPRSGWRGVGGYGLAGGGVRGRGVDAGGFSDCGVFDMVVTVVQSCVTSQLKNKGRFVDFCLRRDPLFPPSHQLRGGIVIL